MNYKHGQYKNNVTSPTVRAWSHMKTRCFNKKSPKYKNYGGRGITVCERWLDVRNFLKDMGDKPVGTSLDRIDVNGNYCPENCRWATDKIQQNNRSNNRFIEIKGVRKSLLEWSEVLNIKYATLYKRYFSSKRMQDNG